MTKHIEEVEKRSFKDKFKIFMIFLVIILTLLYCYARYLGTTGLIVNEITIVNSEIPDSFNGVKIVHFSDLHYGRTINEKELVKMVKQINKIKPDIVVFTGDLIDKDIKVDNAMVNILTTQLSLINSTIGKYAITGNHDYNNDFYKNIMVDSAFNIMNNNYDIVYYKSLKPIFLGGLGNYTYANADIQTVMDYYKTNTDLYTIILMHEPDYMNKMKSYPIDLVLAGHSHNGQVRIPFYGKLYTPKGSRSYYDNYYKINKTDLYISSGMGCSTVNVRLFNRPSINFYRLSNK